MAAIEGSWEVELENMPGFMESMQRVYAWYEGEIIDRAPVRFAAHNAFVEEASASYPSDNIKDRWFDAEFQVETFLKSIAGRRFHAETFPIFWPNLGPEIYSAFYGSPLEYGDVTSWSEPIIKDWDQLADLKLDMQHETFLKIEELTRHALERCPGKALVGYTDIHPGVDCAAAWRDPQQLCFDMIEAPEKVEELIAIALSGFETVYNHFDEMLKAHQQLSVSWLGIPSFGRMHIPSCDFASLISPDMFERFCLPVLQQEVKTMDHNVFHVDGRGVAKDIDMILDVPEVHAIQWVQGVGDDQAIMPWVPFIKKVQARVPIIVDLNKNELDDFMDAVEPEGIFLWIAADNEEEELALLKKVERWT